MYRHRRHLYYAGTLVLALFLVVGLFIGTERSRAVTAASVGNATLRLVPAGKLHAGRLMVVKLVASEVENLGGFQATVTYDPTVLRLTGVSVATELERSGREVLRLGPVRRSGSVSFGAATCPVSDCSSSLRPSPSRLEARQKQGASGQFELARLEFYTETPGRYRLSLDEVEIVEPDGSLLNAYQEAGTTINVDAR